MFEMGDQAFGVGLLVFFFLFIIVMFGGIVYFDRKK